MENRFSNQIIEVFASKESVTVRGLDFKDTRLHRQNGHVKGTTSKVVHSDPMQSEDIMTNSEPKDIASRGLTPLPRPALGTIAWY